MIYSYTMISCFYLPFSLHRTFFFLENFCLVSIQSTQFFYDEQIDLIKEKYCNLWKCHNTMCQKSKERHCRRSPSIGEAIETLETHRLKVFYSNFHLKNFSIGNSVFSLCHFLLLLHLAIFIATVFYITPCDTEIKSIHLWCRTIRYW